MSDHEKVAARLLDGEAFVKEGVVDNDFYGDSVILVGEHDVDLDSLFKELAGKSVRVTIEVL